jgi:hypothetical protein
MTWSRWVSCFMASTAVAAGACERPPNVQVLTESTRLERSKPSPSESSVFDGNVVRLRGARGETLGLEVRISDRRTRSPRLELPESAASVSGFSVRSLAVREPSTDMYGPSAGPGVYPDVLVPAQGAPQGNDLLYFDVKIPQSATPGRYEGELTVDERVIPVVLDVSPARIDSSKNPLVWVFYKPSEIARSAGLPDGDGPELIEKEGEYDALFRAHGAYLASDLPPARFEVRRRFVHDVAYWPVAIDTSSDEAIESDVRRWLDLFRGTGVTPFAIPVDEPHTDRQRARARHIAEVIGRAGGGRPWLLRGVTDAALPAYGDVIDVFISPKNIPRIQLERARGGERFWTYNGRPPQAGSMIVDTDGAALRTWGWIAARYDVELWYAWEGLYFSDRYNHGGPTDVMHDSVTFDERRQGGSDWGNGDGVLVYPGPWPSLRLKALRRGLEDRLLLRELEACGGGETSRDIVRRTVPKALGEADRTPSWPTKETEWAQARGEVLDAIEARCHDGA